MDLKLENSPQVGHVESLWEGNRSRNSEYLAKIKVCEVSHDIDEFYGFRGLSISQEALWISIKNIKCVLKVQHNCNLAQCQPQKSLKTNTGKLPVNSPYWIEHQPFNAYLINLGALYSAESHQSIANISYEPWGLDKWEECIDIGIKSWQSTQEKKKNRKKNKWPETIRKRTN
ncbi:hypothetical protein DFH28DRAFT_903774 [Melampsora americana]|nr:hypothetical protein DFH28DRAFT_903774 [Melampsora americana]